MALTRTQSKRLATILAVMSGDRLPNSLESFALESGWVERVGGDCAGVLTLTESGLDEKNRLCALAGLTIKYASEVGDN